MKRPLREDEGRVAQHLAERPLHGSRVALGLLEEDERGEEEDERGEGGADEDLRDAEGDAHLAREDRPEPASDVHEGVVDRVAERLRLVRRRPGDGPDDARLDERAADRGDQERADDPGLRPDGLDERLPHRHPREADEEVAEREDGEAGREALLEAVAVDDRPREDREEVDGEAVEADEADAEGPEADRLGEEDREDDLRAVEGEALEQLENVGDPERPGEAGLQLGETCGEVQGRSFSGSRRNAASSGARRAASTARWVC